MHIPPVGSDLRISNKPLTMSLLETVMSFVGRGRTETRRVVATNRSRIEALRIVDKSAAGVFPPPISL